MEEKLKNIVESGAEIVGAATGAAIGLIGGPWEVIGGATTGVLITKGLTEFSNKFLSNREQIRVGASTAYTLIGLKEKLNSGSSLRQDNFFDSAEFNRSNAEELFEGVLLKCKNEFEEKKIKYVSNIFKNVAFNVDIDSTDANQILNLAQRVSYRQLKIVALVGQNRGNNLSLRATDYREDEEEHFPDAAKEFVLHDFVTIEKQGLIIRGDCTTVLDLSDIVPGGMELTRVGELFYQLLDLSTMEQMEFTFIGILKELER